MKIYLYISNGENALGFNYTEAWIINGKSRDSFQHRRHSSKLPYRLLFLGTSKLRKTKTNMAKLYKADIVIYLNRDTRICKDVGPGGENFENLENSKE